MNFYFKTTILPFCATCCMLACHDDKQSPILPALNIVQPILDSNRIVFSNSKAGIVAGVQKADGRVEFGAFGSSELHVPLTREMSLGIGSNTKTFTAALIFKLIDQNKLKLSNTLSEILPERVGQNINGTITIDQLLTHSSGLFDPLNQGNLADAIFSNPTYSYSIDEYLNLVNTQSPNFPNGTKYSYSNTNYMLLGLIIEKISGKEYHEFLRNEILQPLGLSHTFLSGKENSVNTIGYSWSEKDESYKNWSRNGIESVAWSAGSIFSTPGDMLKWYSALFGGKVISEKSLKKMKESYPGEMDRNYGSGIFYLEHDGDKIFYFSGRTIAYDSYTIYDDTTKDIVSVIQNTMITPPNGGTPNVKTVAFQLLDKLKQK
ncbi:D-alanyl-D-alanine carboxypeptidase [Chryseobacterium rhizosphaerae]|uniref:serine hydrolase domain-containing protein n=1 Tax=Chryseobacterium rhizosphaerae TaxID=395937 RepID=UPI00285C6376|nr:serine hydrolase domain-containing protein [Chryseobacterium rhizosphaerae]MDR6544187.1 D-alanyl-D-alanine carboxypeptidase [Chryseobacterium rhizosphaerae]